MNRVRAAARPRGVSRGAPERGREVVAAWATPSTHGAAVYETLLYARRPPLLQLPGVGLCAEGPAAGLSPHPRRRESGR